LQILRKEMSLRGLTAKDLATKIGLSAASVHAWMNGSKPSPSSVVKLKELGFSETACLDPGKDIEV
jgi:transcriptional regulator with XRE-family HTH domain